MPSKRHKAEGIVTKLRQVDVLTAPGRPDPGLGVRLPCHSSIEGKADNALRYNLDHLTGFGQRPIGIADWVVRANR